MIKKIILGLLAVIVLIVAVVAAAAIMTPTECKVEREIVINRPKGAVFDYLKTLKNQNAWGPWYKKDPGMKQEFRGTDASVGFVTTWKSEHPEVGAGEQEIKRIVEGERIDTQLRFTEPMASTADAYLITEAAGADSTKVKWGFSTSMPRPLNLIQHVVDMDAAVGGDFQSGLNNLKQILETPPIVN